MGSGRRLTKCGIGCSSYSSSAVYSGGADGRETEDSCPPILDDCPAVISAWEVFVASFFDIELSLVKSAMILEVRDDSSKTTTGKILEYCVKNTRFSYCESQDC